MEELELTLPGLNFGGVDFTIAEVDTIIAEEALIEDGDPADDLLHNADKGHSRTHSCDIWAFGDHRLICGGSRDYHTVGALMNRERAQMVLTDPPYNVPLGGNEGGLGRTQHGEFAMASGKMTPVKFTEFQGQIFGVLVAYNVDGFIHFICMDWRRMLEVQTTAQGQYTELKNVIF